MLESEPFVVRMLTGTVDIPPDSNTKYTQELLIFIHYSLDKTEVRLCSLGEQILYSSVGLFGCQKMKVSSPEVRQEKR